MERNSAIIFYSFLIGFILIVFVLFHTKKNIKRKKCREIKTKIEKVIKSKPIEKKVIVDNSDIKYYLEQNQNIQTPLVSDNSFTISGLNNLNEIQMHDINGINILDDIQNYDLVDEIYVDFPRNTIVENYERNVIQNLINRPDSQNVHDRVVQNTIKHKFKLINEKVPSESKNEKDIISEIIKYSKQDPTKYAKIPDILNQISSRSASVQNINSNEMEVLEKTWISSKELQKDQILNELLDCIEKDRLVCPTGVVSRIINSDVVLNPEKASKTIENLREEMMNTAAKVRSDLEEQSEFKNKTDNEQSEFFKENLIKKYEENYKDIIDMDIVKGEYEKWINEI